VSINPLKPAARLPRAGDRVSDEPAFVLHRHAWKETSLLLDVFTRTHGRIAVVAKGAKRPHSALRSTLVNFQPLAVSYSGKGEVKTLSRAEWVGGSAPLVGTALLGAFYFNELLMRLLAREDAHAALFDAYLQALLALQQQPGSIEQTLRGFELALLTETGLMPPLDQLAASGERLEPAREYAVTPEGVRERTGAADALLVEGRHLLALQARDWGTPGLAPRAKAVMRMLIAYHLGERPLRTRQLLIDLHNL
jgi:DNA repair protein RecO (recombination protein O)